MKRYRPDTFWWVDLSTTRLGYKRVAGMCEQDAAARAVGCENLGGPVLVPRRGSDEPTPARPTATKIEKDAGRNRAASMRPRPRTYLSAPPTTRNRPVATRALASRRTSGTPVVPPRRKERGRAELERHEPYAEAEPREESPLVRQVGPCPRAWVHPPLRIHVTDRNRRRPSPGTTLGAGRE